MSSKPKKKEGFLKKVGKLFTPIKKVGKAVMSKIEQTQKATDFDTMSDETKLHAHIANQSYSKVGQREKSLGGYELDESFSGKKHAVYHNKNTNKTIISYRGTDPTDAEDLYNDAHILKGTQATTDRYKRSEKLYDDVASKYGSNITATGHSLGGNISEHIARKKGAKAETFNTGRGIDKNYAVASAKCFITKYVGKRPKYCDNVKRHHIVGDPLSATNKGYGKAYSYRSKGIKSHSLENFLGKDNPIERFRPQKQKSIVSSSLG